MDGTRLCSYYIEKTFRWITGISVLYATHLVVLCRTDVDKNKHRVCMLTWTDNGLNFTW
jgi:hypothetical protein